MCVSLENKLRELSNGTARLLTISLKIQLCLYITSRGTVSKNRDYISHFHGIYCFIMHKYHIFFGFQILENVTFFPPHWELCNCRAVVLAVGLNSDEWTESWFNSRSVQPSVTGTSTNSPGPSGPWEHLEEKMPPPHITHAHQLAVVQKRLKTKHSLSG